MDHLGAGAAGAFADEVYVGGGTVDNARPLVDLAVVR